MHLESQQFYFSRGLTPAIFISVTALQNALYQGKQNNNKNQQNYGSEVLLLLTKLNSFGSASALSRLMYLYKKI